MASYIEVSRNNQCQGWELQYKTQKIRERVWEKSEPYINMAVATGNLAPRW
jgi:hypothetical protein